MQRWERLFKIISESGRPFPWHLPAPVSAEEFDSACTRFLKEEYCAAWAIKVERVEMLHRVRYILRWESTPDDFGSIEIQRVNDSEIEVVIDSDGDADSDTWVRRCFSTIVQSWLAEREWAPWWSAELKAEPLGEMSDPEPARTDAPIKRGRKRTTPEEQRRIAEYYLNNQDTMSQAAVAEHFNVSRKSVQRYVKRYRQDN